MVSLDTDAGLGGRAFLNGLEQCLSFASPLRSAVKLTGFAPCAAIHMNSDDFHEQLLMSIFYQILFKKRLAASCILYAAARFRALYFIQMMRKRGEKRKAGR